MNLNSIWLMANNVVILYSELAGYLLSGLRRLAPRVDVIRVYHWPINPEAPFIFDPIEGVEMVDRTGLSVTELISQVDSLSPKALICSGWIDKDYLKVVKGINADCVKIIAFDTMWKGTMKQWIWTVLSRFQIRSRFDHAWVAGEPQARYARKLGFSNNEVDIGFYSADIPLFNQMYAEKQLNNSTAYPKRFLYLGRYVRHKGIFEMWDAFLKANQTHGSHWQLWCIGTGDEWENRVEAEGIKHIGFVQPNELADFVRECGVFVLPSKYEPWGVVAHEMAAAGLPLLLSKAVGASSHFLEGNENGFSFDIEENGALLDAFSRFMRLSDEELRQMSEKSHQIGQTISPSKWADTLCQFLYL